MLYDRGQKTGSSLVWRSLIGMDSAESVQNPIKRSHILVWSNMKGLPDMLCCQTFIQCHFSRFIIWIKKNKNNNSSSNHHNTHAQQTEKTTLENAWLKVRSILAKLDLSPLTDHIIGIFTPIQHSPQSTPNTSFEIGNHLWSCCAVGETRLKLL